MTVAVAALALSSIQHEVVPFLSVVLTSGVDILSVLARSVYRPAKYREFAADGRPNFLYCRLIGLVSLLAEVKDVPHFPFYLASARLCMQSAIMLWQLCPSVCRSHCAIASKRMHISSDSLHRLVGDRMTSFFSTTVKF